MFSFKEKLIAGCVGAFSTLMVMGLLVIVYAIILHKMAAISDHNYATSINFGLTTMVVSSVPAFTLLVIAVTAIIKPVILFIKERLSK